MDQITARRLAALLNDVDPETQAVATTEDARHGRWEETHNWIVTTATTLTYYEVPDGVDFDLPLDDEAPGAVEDAEADEYPWSRAPRHDSGCPACGADVTPSPTKEVWPRHTIGGEPGAEKCPLSGVRNGFDTDGFFRRFIDRDTPPVSTGDGSYYKYTDLERFGTAIGVLNTVYAPSEPGGGAVVAQVRTLITQADYPRFRAELDRLAAEQGWDSK